MTGRRRNGTTTDDLGRVVSDLCDAAGFARDPLIMMWTANEERRAKARDYAYVYPSDLEFHFSKKILDLDDAHRHAVVAHEVGHCLAQHHWGSSTEPEADAAAAQWLGMPICYDHAWPGKGLQVVCARQSNPQMPKHFYHGSPDPLQIGTRLGGRRRKHLQKLEDIIEKNRPTGYPSRIAGVFMVARPADVSLKGGDDRYVYEVQPSHDVVRVDQWWFEQTAYQISRGAKESVATAARGYWSGRPFDPDEAVWEYLASFAKVLRVIKQPREHNPPSCAEALAQRLVEGD